MIIGITGSSGAGKSTVCNILEKNYQVKLISADEVAKQLAKKGNNYLKEIIQNFGAGILLDNGELNRKKLADIIYYDETKRKKLNLITYHHVGNAIQKKARSMKNEAVVIDIPLLFESGLNKICDVTIAVITTNVEAQVQRIMKRDSITKEHAIARINTQKSNDFYSNGCTYTIENNGNMTNLEKQVNSIFSKLI